VVVGGALANTSLGTIMVANFGPASAVGTSLLLCSGAVADALVVAAGVGAWEHGKGS